MTKKIIIFTHIPKTSGKYIIQYLVPYHRNRRLHNRMRQRGEITLLRGRIISGHIPFGIHSRVILFETHFRLDIDNAAYFTFLREPISRWTSLFFYSIGRKTPAWIDSGRNLIKFLESCIDEEKSTNIMAKQLSGLESTSDIILNGKPAYSWAARKRRYTMSEMKAILNASKNNILNKYTFVGEMGREDHYRNLCAINKWKYRKYHPLNKQYSKKNKKKKLGIQKMWSSKKVQSLIYEINKFDIKLYKFARNNIWK